MEYNIKSDKFIKEFKSKYIKARSSSLTNKEWHININFINNKIIILLLFIYIHVITKHFIHTNLKKFKEILIKEKLRPSFEEINKNITF